MAISILYADISNGQKQLAKPQKFLSPWLDLVFFRVSRLFCLTHPQMCVSVCLQVLQVLPVEAWEFRSVKARKHACLGLCLHATPAVGMATYVFASLNYSLVQTWEERRPSASGSSPWLTHSSLGSSSSAILWNREVAHKKSEYPEPCLNSCLRLVMNIVKISVHLPSRLRSGKPSLITLQSSDKYQRLRHLGWLVPGASYIKVRRLPCKT